MDPNTVASGSPDAGATGGDQTPLLDRTRQGLYDALWHSAMRVDQFFGSQESEDTYRKLYGSIAPAVLWDEHYGLSAPVRFNAYFPLPQLDERFHAFVGRFDPNEYITEREEPSGAFRRQYGPTTEDQTVLGLAFGQPPAAGGHFDAGAGVRVSVPLDPYVKAGYVYLLGSLSRGQLTLRQSGFWEEKQGFGVTTRADLERIFATYWLARYRASATWSERTQGLAAWSTVDVMRSFASRRAIAFEAEIDGQTDAPVPLHNFGCKIAYRQSVVRNWLILELRTSLSWPKDTLDQQRHASFGVGAGLEMLFGTEKFSARPVTF